MSGVAPAVTAARATRGVGAGAAQSFLHGRRGFVTDEHDVGCPGLVGAVVAPAALVSVAESFLNQQVRGLVGVRFKD